MQDVAKRHEGVEQLAFLGEGGFAGLVLPKLEEPGRADVCQKALAQVARGAADVGHAEAAASVRVAEREGTRGPLRDLRGDDLDSEAEGSDEAGGAHGWLDLTFGLTGD
jgi:hypothetical protein